MERLVEPIVADLQAEYDASAAHGAWRTRWLVWRGYGAFWKALGLHCIISTFQPSRPESNDSIGRVVVFSLGALTLMTALLIVPPMLDFRYFRVADGPLEKVRLILLLVPQALPLSIPTGICVGVICAMRGRPTKLRHVAAVLAIAAMATLAVWTMLEWGVPAGNQAFRDLLAMRLGDGRPVHLEAGLNELGLSRLSQRTDAGAVEHTRLLWALCFATGPLALFSLGLARNVRHLGVAIVFSFTAIVIYWVLMANIDAALRAGPFGGAGAWAGNFLFMLAGVLMLRYGQKNFRLPSLR
jgi:lipopolysaccharide export LptBFGC system permease protein LptF